MRLAYLRFTGMALNRVRLSNTQLPVPNYEQIGGTAADPQAVAVLC
jgi:hypothetical protein